MTHLIYPLIAAPIRVELAQFRELASFAQFGSDLDKTTKEQLANLDVKPKPSNIPQDDGIMTLEKFNKMSMTEQAIFKRENPDVYAELNN